MSSRTPKKEDVIAFFVKLFNMEITEETKSNIHTFFCNARDLIAVLFLQPDGLEKFSEAVTHAFVGVCAANPENQLRAALFGCLVEDKSDKILFNYFYEKIAIPVINSGGDVMRTKGNVFDILQIRNLYISPVTIFQQLKREFCDSTTQAIKSYNPWEFLQDYFRHNKELTIEMIDLLSNDQMIIR
jgi:hypothetical protein